MSCIEIEKQNQHSRMDQSTMIANLPLLFVGGFPASLDAMGVLELERFVPFLLHCSWGHDTAERIRKPRWWPADVPFSEPFRPPPHPPSDWVARLRSLVRACYIHHDSQFLLEFSEELSRHCPSALRYVDNCGCRTTSLHSRRSGKLLVTFRNEHIFYDRKPAEVDSRRRLLPRRTESLSDGDSAIEDADADLYLCDTCDLVLHSLNEARRHEAVCLGRTNAPEPVLAGRDSEPDPLTDRDCFMRALGLVPPDTGNEKPPPLERMNTSANTNSVRARRTTYPGRSYCFPFSSEAGRRAYSNRWRPPEATARQREIPDRHCRAPPLGRERPAWLKGPTERRRAAGGPKRKDRRRLRKHTFPGQRGRPVLDLRSQLLYLSLGRRRPRIVLTCMTTREIDEYRAQLKLSAEMRASHFSDFVCSDSEIEFVSVTVGDGLSRSSTNRPTFPLSFEDDIIDLCSDGEGDESGGGDENLVPAPGSRRAGGSVFIQSMALVATPEAERPAEPTSLTEAARCRPPARRKSSFSRIPPFSGALSPASPKLKFQPLQQLHDNLKGQVIFID